MKTIVVTNQKGGVGKTTIADEIAFYFERLGVPLSFFDLDGQGGAIHKTQKNPDAVVAVVDMPGALLKELKNALLQADLIIVPFRPTAKDVEPVRRMWKIIRSAVPDTPVFFVINGMNRYRAAFDFVRWFDREFGVMRYLVPQSEAIVQASALGKSVIEYAKGGAAANHVQMLCAGIGEILGFASNQ